MSLETTVRVDVTIALGESATALPQSTQDSVTASRHTHQRHEPR